MKVYAGEELAKESIVKKTNYFLNGACPHSPLGHLCGSWCALFYLCKKEENTSAFVILGCKTGQTRLYIEEIIGE